MEGDPDFPRLTEYLSDPVIVIQEPTPPESTGVPKKPREIEEGRLKEPSEKSSRRHQEKKAELYHENVRAAEVAAQEATPRYKANDKVRVKMNGNDDSIEKNKVKEILEGASIAAAEANDQPLHRKHRYHITHHYHIHHHHYHTNFHPGADGPQYRRSESKHRYYAEPPPAHDLHGYVQLPGCQGVHVQSKDPHALRSQAEFRDRHQLSRSQSQYCRRPSEHDKEDHGSGDDEGVRSQPDLRDNHQRSRSQSRYRRHETEHSKQERGSSDEEDVRSSGAPERTKSYRRYRAYPPTAAVINGDVGDDSEEVLKTKVKESEDKGRHNRRQHQESLPYPDTHTRTHTRSRARAHTSHTHLNASASRPKLVRDDSQRRRSVPVPAPVLDTEQGFKDISGLAERRRHKQRENGSKRERTHNHQRHRQRQRSPSLSSVDSVTPADSASQVGVSTDESTGSKSKLKSKLRK
ncbi:hypothetical protein F4806DRAFT_495919 [Annulohypoxylon nitens]|nr:hypothetical protein F4806DRAFT_495919 [Annulohypoxylon nitens]